MFEEFAAFLPWQVDAPDLPGHGAAGGIPPAFESAVRSVAQTVERRPLLGYSQGGRIALGVAVEYPRSVSHLILVSSSPGIADPGLRRDRLKSDAVLADRIESEGLEPFIDRWLAQPLLDGLHRRGSEWCERDRKLRLENRTAGLAAALRGMGQGSQPYFGGRLGELRMPVLVVAGALDPAYVAIGTRIASAAPRGMLVTVEGAGHAVIGEAPDKVADEVGRFLVGSS